jgi:hypothetical protein
MSDINAPAESAVEIRAVVTRADGTVVDLGVIDARYKNPVKQALWTHVRKPLADRRIRNANRNVNQEG